ncbi:MAG: YfiR family protein [Candidatus Tectomicrobia bacterium]|nr:YfiR family protein [Candidatus Tectomicrobia bacterium]
MNPLRWLKKKSGHYALRVSVLVAMCGHLLLASQSIPAPSSALIKVAYLYNFAKFVEWPPEAFANGQTSFTLCVIGTDSFVGALPSIQGKPIKGLKVEIKYFTHTNTLEACHILFVSASEEHQVSDIVMSLQNYPVLTVADMENFTNLGGMINFIKKEHKIHFAINVKASQRTGLHIRSKLLKLAKIVD